MGRAERRRLEKQKGKQVKTYNLTRSQLHNAVRQVTEEDLKRIKQEAMEDAINTAMTLSSLIRLKMKYDKNNLLITIENSYRGKLAKGKGEELRTTKTDTSNHGIGLPSVRRAADKYQGVLSVDTTEPGRFLARVVLYGS